MQAKGIAYYSCVQQQQRDRWEGAISSTSGTRSEGVGPQDSVGRINLPIQFIGYYTSKEFIRLRESRWLQSLYRFRGSQVLEGVSRLRRSKISEGVYKGRPISLGVNGLRGRVGHLEELPPQVQVGEMHVPVLKGRCHGLKRPNMRFMGRRILWVVFSPWRIQLFQ